MPVMLSVFSTYDPNTGVSKVDFQDCSFTTLAAAKEHALYLATSGDSKRLRFFFQVTSEKMEVWFTAKWVRDLGRRTPKCVLVESYAPVIGYGELALRDETAKAKKNLAELQDWLKKLEKDKEEMLARLEYEHHHLRACREALNDIRDRPAGRCSAGPSYPAERRRDPEDFADGTTNWYGGRRF